MLLEIYPDIIFLINFILNGTILYIAACIFKEKVRVYRFILAIIISAFLGTAISLILNMNLFIKLALIHPIIITLTIVTAFGITTLKDIIKKDIILVLVTYIFGGFMNSLYYHISFRKLIAVTLFIVLPLSKIVLAFLKNRNDKRNIIYGIDLILDGKIVHTKGLMDTGNSLYDNLNQKPIIIVTNNVIDSIFSESLKADIKILMESIGNKDSAEQSNCIIKDENLLRLRIIPYQAIGTVKGCLVGVILDELNIYKDKQKLHFRKITAAIYNKELSVDNEYQVILHRELIN